MIDLTHIAESLPVRFYSNTLPEGVAWSFVLVHLEDYHVRLRQYDRFAKHIILDIHVHRFREQGDYPIAVLRQYMYVIKRLADKYRDKICFVLPDLPWDPKIFHGVQYPHNIRKTYTYHVMFMRYVDEICRRYGSQMMLVVQHRQSLADADRSSIIVNDLLSWVREEHVYAIGIGSLCINRSAREISQYVKHIYYRFLDRRFRIHGFGVRLDVIDYLPGSILARYSYDSTGWTKPVCNRVPKIVGVSKRRSCMTALERQVYFLAYVARLCEKLGRSCIAHELWDLAEKIVKKRVVS